MSNANTDFEKSVLEKLDRLEASRLADQSPNPENYFTVKHAFGALGFAVLVAAGFAGWLINQVDKKIDAQTAALERQIDLVVTQGLGQLEASLKSNLRGAEWIEGTLVSHYPPPGLVPVDDFKGMKFGFARSDDGSVQSIINEALIEAIAGGEIDVIDGNEIYIKENGDFKPLFPKQ